MKTTSNLIIRKGKFQFFMKIPKDLSYLFSGKLRIQKSLHTSSEEEAKALASQLREKVKSQFLLLRSGLLSEDQIQAIVENLGGKRSPKPDREVPKKISEIMKLYIEEKTPNWKARTKRDNKVALDRIILMLGDMGVDECRRSDVVRLRGKLLHEGLSERTCNRHIGLLSSTLRWATRHSYAQANVAESLMLDIPRSRDSERKRFNCNDIQEIIDHIPLKSGDEANVWIPLIALYTGMRREEICQLRRSDVFQESDIWCFRINEGEEQSLKTNSSRRVVPIHSKIIKMGFIEFCNDRATGKDGGNLWGFVRWRETWGKSWGGWFNRWYSANIQMERGKCFHSFRHTIADELKQSGEHRELVAELLGHSVTDMTFGRYGKKYSVQNLKLMIENINYNIDLSRFELFVGIN